jgi:hypothetical protein
MVNALYLSRFLLASSQKYRKMSQIIKTGSAVGSADSAVDKSTNAWIAVLKR